MKNYIKIFLMLVLISGRSYSQYTNVLITNTGSPNEPSICINPKNTNIVVAGSNLNFYFYSTNSGLNWTKQTLTSTYSVWGDPSITAVSYTHLTLPTKRIV